MDLLNCSLKYLKKSLNKIEQNQPVNIKLIESVNRKYSVLPPNSFYLFRGNVKPVENISYDEIEELKEKVLLIIEKLTEPSLSSSLQIAAPPGGSPPSPGGSSPAPPGGSSPPPPRGSSPPPRGSPGGSSPLLRGPPKPPPVLGEPPLVLRGGPSGGPPRGPPRGPPFNYDYGQNPSYDDSKPVNKSTETAPHPKDFIGKNIIVTNDQIITYRIRSDHTSENYPDYYFVASPLINNEWIVAAFNKPIPTVLPSAPFLPGNEILKYAINANGRSEFFPHVYFIAYQDQVQGGFNMYYKKASPEFISDTIILFDQNQNKPLDSSINPYQELLIMESNNEFKFSPIFPNYKFKIIPYNLNTRWKLIVQKI